MIQNSLLFPTNNIARTSIKLDGMWKFSFDPKAEGQTNKWFLGLPKPISMPVPGSFSDVFTDNLDRDYVGDFWYETDFFVSKDFKDEVNIRFGSVTHVAEVYCNGVKIATHKGGFTPFNARITDVVKLGEKNLLSIKVNNRLSEEMIPCGIQKTLNSGREITKPYFDFYNYSGIHRSVWLQSIPKETIVDYNLTYELNGNIANVYYDVITNGENEVSVSLKDKNGNYVATSVGKEGCLKVENPNLWQVRNAYLYEFVIQIKKDGNVIDEYTEKVGIRTIEVKGKHILVNGSPVYLKGYGKHEDFGVLGRGFNYGVMKRDFECMKWTDANCFRTSHYPYSEEWYQFADEEGFLIIDEVPAVGMMRSTHNFVAAGAGTNYTYFFEAPTVPALLENHLQQVEEMIQRDKNHPSVFAWSLFNEPETTSESSRNYFSKVFDFARTLDKQKRPMTGALEKNSSPEKCQCYTLCDFICLNRYYGWYISGGPDIEEAEEKFRDEMDRWGAKNLNIPFVFTEFGTDTLSTEHKLPSVMWSQEYQNEYLERNFNVFDSYDWVQGELVWNFADFQTVEGIMRVNGNKKGVFTRDRQPKDAAFLFKNRWSKLPLDYKGK